MKPAPVVDPYAPLMPDRTWVNTAIGRANIRAAELERALASAEDRAARAIANRMRRHWRIVNSIKDRPHILLNLRDLKATWHWLRGAA